MPEKGVKPPVNKNGTPVTPEMTVRMGSVEYASVYDGEKATDFLIPCTLPTGRCNLFNKETSADQTRLHLKFGPYDVAFPIRSLFCSVCVFSGKVNIPAEIGMQRKESGLADLLPVVQS